MQMAMHQFVPGVSTDMICINSALIKTKSKNMTKIITNIKMFFFRKAKGKCSYYWHFKTKENNLVGKIKIGTDSSEKKTNLSQKRSQSVTFAVDICVKVQNQNDLSLTFNFYISKR